MYAKEIIEKLLLRVNSNETLMKRYFELILIAIDINLERINNEPKINVSDFVVNSFVEKFSANEMFLFWYDVYSPLRNIMELDSDKILSNNTDIR